MQIEKAADGDVTTLKISGEIDLHASPALRTELQACLEEKTPRLLLDFTDVGYIDSSGLATLIEYVRECGKFGGRLALFGLKAKVKTIFELVRLNELFSISATSDEALAAIAAK
ncbi:MAG: STAS domain-containing protein [Terrimicrobiaceae bacterium]|nr:STAS domain-containing protein [Terrimicrobiaceae bacterium]